MTRISDPSPLTKHTDLEWRDTGVGPVPISTRFDDPYYSLDNGLEETEYVFLGANNLTKRLKTAAKERSAFHIAELGFGTGLNALAALKLWQTITPTPHSTLHFTSFEAFPMSQEQAGHALTPFQDLVPIHALLPHWDAIFKGQVEIAPGFHLHVITGDARQEVPSWDGTADCWFLDGFSPAKNPELWGASLMEAVYDHTKQGGTASTYSAAGHVRAALTGAGFTCEKVKGFGRKRHMTIATRNV